MALRSMTGYAKVSGQILTQKLDVEIRSVNNRFLEIQMRLPRQYNHAEMAIRKMLKQTLDRGSVQVNFHIEGSSSENIPTGFNSEIVKAYLNIAQDISSTFGINNQLNIKDILDLPDVLSFDSVENDPEAIEKNLLSVLEDAIASLQDMRSKEGQAMADDMNLRVSKINNILDQVEEVLPKRTEEIIVKIRERMLSLIEDSEFDENRFLQETASLAERLDISEEITRFRSHNIMFQQCLLENGPHGKKLNFILQEMGREANTLGTKSQYAPLGHLAVSLKEEVECIREQVQNIE